MCKPKLQNLVLKQKNMICVQCTDGFFTTGYCWLLIISRLAFVINEVRITSLPVNWLHCKSKVVMQRSYVSVKNLYKISESQNLFIYLMWQHPVLRKDTSSEYSWISIHAWYHTYHYQYRAADNYWLSEHNTGFENFDFELMLYIDSWFIT